MNAPASVLYSAGQIAVALDLHREEVARMLGDSPADGRQVIKGKPVPAWSLAALPPNLQSDLETAAMRKGFRTAAALLAVRSGGWLPSVPLEEIAPVALNKAVKLQRVLARYLAGQKNPLLTADALQAIGIEDYAREFGHAITARHLQRLVKRAVDRDAGAEQWDWLCLYLPDNPPRKRALRTPGLSVKWETEFEQLRAALASISDPITPNQSEKAFVWLRTFEIFEEKIAGGRESKKLKSLLLKFLGKHAGFLASGNATSKGEAIRRNFERKYDRWVREERRAKALADARPQKSGRFAEITISEEDRDKLIAHATLNCGGRVAQAWRELLERREISEQIAGHYLSGPSRKSYVPRRVLDSVKYEVAMMEDIHHGPRQHKLNGAHLSRDWSAVNAMDWLQADDFTMPVYFCAPDGRGGFDLMRGQVLLMIDARSTRILGFVLLSDRNYNAHAIRSLITHICDEYGLPRKGFYFERGIWEKSKLLKGDVNAEALSWGETEMGLREFGLIFSPFQSAALKARGTCRRRVPKSDGRLARLCRQK